MRRDYSSLDEDSVIVTERKFVMNSIRDYHEVKLLVSELGQREDPNEPIEENRILSDFSMNNHSIITALSLAKTIIEWNIYVTKSIQISGNMRMDSLMLIQSLTLNQFVDSLLLPQL